MMIQCIDAMLYWPGVLTQAFVCTEWMDKDTRYISTRLLVVTVQGFPVIKQKLNTLFTLQIRMYASNLQSTVLDMSQHATHVAEAAKQAFANAPRLYTSWWSGHPLERIPNGTLSPMQH